MVGLRTSPDWDGLCGMKMRLDGINFWNPKIARSKTEANP
jgi:hypothetical protein